MESADWFYVRGDDEVGPFSGEQLQELLARGEIGPHTLIRKTAWMDWREAGTLSLLSAKPSPTNSADRVEDNPPLATDPRPVEPAARPKPRARLWLVAAIVASLLIVATVTWSLSTRFEACVSDTRKAEAPSPVPDPWWAESPVQSPQDERAEKEQRGNSQIDWEKELADIPDVSSLTEPAVAPSQAASSGLRKALDPVALYAQSKPAVATIETTDDNGLDVGQGSGFFISESMVGSGYPKPPSRESDRQGYQLAFLLTNYHVIRSAAIARVRLSDGRTGNVVDVVKERQDADLAVVSVYVDDADRKLTKPVGTLPILHGPEPPVGERVYAIGSPKGLDASLSEGIISGRREGNEESARLQFTAPVSPGSSGGPLLDATGQVVGVVTALRRGGQNLNFAVPASVVARFLRSLFNTRELWRGSGINQEEDDAYLSARVASAIHKLEGKVSGEFLGFLSKYKEKVGDEAYGRTLESLAPTAAAQIGEWEYLLHFTMGRFAYSRALKSEVALFKSTNSSSSPQLQAIAQANKDERRAETYFAKAIQLNPAFSPSYVCLAESLHRQGRFAESLKVAEQLLRRVPRCAKSYNIRGACYRGLDRDSQALTDFQTAAELAPNDPDNYVELGGCYLGLRENEKAIEAYETAIRLLPPKSIYLFQCYFSMGTCYERMGKVEQAKACREKARSPASR